MRQLIALALLVAGCTPAWERVQQSYEPFEGPRVDIWRYGDSALDISIDPDGDGRFRINRYPKVEVGRFHVTSAQYADFRARLDVFRVDAKPFTPEALSAGTNQCGDGSLAISDAGGIVVRWVDTLGDDILKVKLGCPRVSTKVRDDQLRDFVFGYANGLERNLLGPDKR